MARPSNPHPYHKTVTRYETADGRRCGKAEPGAQKRTTKTATYYADVPGLGTVSLETTNEHQAWVTLRDKLKTARELALGIIDEQTEHAKTEIGAHIDQWAATLEAKGTSALQIALAIGRLKRLAALACWKRLPQIDLDSAMLALAKVRMSKDRGGLGKSAASRNHYLGHLRAFVAWAHEVGRMRTNPIRRIKPVGIEDDRRHARRMPSPEEVSELCRWLSSDAAPIRRGLSKEERRLGYLVSMATGFRAGELRSLDRESFDLAAATVTVAAAFSKRRRKDTQHLPAWLVEELKRHFKSSSSWGWAGLRREAPGKMLRADIQEARIAWIAAATEKTERARREKSSFLCYKTRTPQGFLFFDYHSLRHAYNSFIANLPGIDPKTLLTLTRLSSAELALKTYAHAQEERIKATVAQIPAPKKERSDP